MSRNCLLLFVATSVLSASFAEAQTQPSTPPPAGCKSEQQRQFDFWIGDWDVTVGGKPAGRNRIERILEGCALLENWSGAGGMSGKSLNFYDPLRSQWHQTWIDDRGGSLGLDGTFANGKMVLSGAKKDPKSGKTNFSRITWTALPSGEVRQLWETSSDEKSWTVAFDGLYKRRK